MPDPTFTHPKDLPTVTIPAADAAKVTTLAEWHDLVMATAKAQGHDPARGVAVVDPPHIRAAKQAMRRRGVGDAHAPFGSTLAKPVAPIAFDHPLPPVGGGSGADDLCPNPSRRSLIKRATALGAGIVGVLALGKAAPASAAYCYTCRETYSWCNYDDCAHHFERDWYYQYVQGWGCQGYCTSVYWSSCDGVCSCSWWNNICGGGGSF